MSALSEEVVKPIVADESLQVLRQSVASFNQEQLLWSSGYLAGLAASMVPAANPALSIAPQINVSTSERTWHLFYATETGNSRQVAERVAEQYRGLGLATQVRDLSEVAPKQLQKVERAVFVLATHGIGEAPEGTETFFDYWFSDKASRLERLEYSVLALGDSSYVDFCEMGRRFDVRLAELGAKAVVERVDCDLDFESASSSWIDSITEIAKGAATPVKAETIELVSPTQAASVATRQNPVSVDIQTVQKISGSTSSKDVRHIEIDIEGSGIVYQPGDSLGIHAKNSPYSVEAVLAATNFTGDEEVSDESTTASLREALFGAREITALTLPVLKTLSQDHADLAPLLTDRAALAKYLSTHQLVDSLHDFSYKRDAQAFFDMLRPLPPRVYSIASSPDANPDEAHLTVGVVDYEKYGRNHWGTGSNFLINQSGPIDVFVEANERFRLPADTTTPIIMIGPGTGVAPFRAFVEHRQTHGHTGKNWLIFGDRNFSSDFLYQREWLRYRRDGILSELDVAFSRDQQEKIYVQDRMRQRGKTIFEWLENGARIYVCGDAESMAPDVHEALLEIVEEHGGSTREDATAYVSSLKRDRRYLRDVY